PRRTDRGRYIRRPGAQPEHRRGMAGDPHARRMARRQTADPNEPSGQRAHRAARAREHASLYHRSQAPRRALEQDPHTGFDGPLDRFDERGGLRRLLRADTHEGLRHGGKPPPPGRGGRRRDEHQGRGTGPPAMRPGQPLDAALRADARAACGGVEASRNGIVNFDPRHTVFAILSFEGPDRYSQAGGLGVRVKGLARSLARIGYPTYLYFCGDPDLPGEEEQEGGRLQYRRWCQWISSMHRGGVYDGEEGKIRDWNSSLPPSLIENVIAPAISAGNHVVVLGEEWHTSWSMKLISDALYYRGLRDRVVMLWNANNTYGFNRIDWTGLNFATTVTTVSRYMKFRMWEWGQNPIVIPNGISRESIVEADPQVVDDLRRAAGADHFWFKIGRFDPDKRWLMAVSAAAQLKRRGNTVKLVV